LVLTSAPPLPAPSASDFSTVLAAKLAIIDSECCWDDPDADASAKRIKTDTLKELIEFVRPEADLPPEIAQQLIPAVERPIFRPWVDLGEIYVRSDDMPTFTECTWPHLCLHFQLLNAIVTTFPNEPRFGEASYLRLVIERFRMPDANERVALAALLNVICATHPSLRDVLLKLVLFATADYADRQRSPYVTCPALIVALACFSASPPTPENTTDLPLYFEYILPLLSTLHYASFQTQIGDIVELFVRGVPALAATRTVKSMIGRFPFTRSSKAIEFVRLLTVVLSKTPIRDVKANMRPIFLLYARCMTLGQVKLASIATMVWNRIELEPLIMDKAKFVFALVYPILSAAERETWSPDIASSVDVVFRVFNRIDSAVFQDLCRGRLPPVPGPQLQDEMKTWALVARTASKVDTDIRLSDKLNEIQKRFAVPRQQTFKPAANPAVLSPAVKQSSQPVTIEKPLGVRSDLRPMIRSPT
jgi:hypothetical protein